MTKKVWELHMPGADSTDATYIMGLGCEVEVIMPKWYEFTSVNGIRSQYLAENPHIEIVTTCEKQESMLYLKYSNNLHLRFVYDENIDLAPHSR
jgi:hypothetical protein